MNNENDQPVLADNDQSINATDQNSAASPCYAFLRAVTDCCFINEAIITNDIHEANAALDTHGDNWSLVGVSQERVWDTTGGFRDITTFHTSRRIFILWGFLKNVCSSFCKAAIIMRDATGFGGKQDVTSP